MENKSLFVKNWLKKTRTGGYRNKRKRNVQKLMNTVHINTFKASASEFLVKEKVPQSPSPIEFNNAMETEDSLESNYQCGFEEIDCESKSNEEDVHSTYSSLIQNRNFEFNKDKFVSELVCWAIRFNVNNAQLRGFLDLWNNNVPLPELPKDPRTLLKTPRMLDIFVDPNGKGKYWHYGLTRSLETTLSSAPIDQLPKEIELNFHVDGLQIFNSSNETFWPILMNILEMPQVTPMVVGINSGPRK